MTLSTSTNKITYTCNGTTNEFAVPFLFFADSHISVQIKTNDGQAQTLKQDDDYTLSGTGNAAGGTCVLTAAPENGAELLILRDVPYKQETRYIDGDPMPAPLLERNLDALTMMCQQLEEQCARAVAVDMFSASNPSEIIGKVEDLYADKDNLDIVAKNIAAVDVCSDNIKAIKDAPNQASAASASASAALASQQQSAASATAAANSAAESANQAQASAASAAAAAASAAEAKVGLATDAEFSAGTATNKAPTVKQAAGFAPKAMFQVVSALPASPNANVFYFIPE